MAPPTSVLVVVDYKGGTEKAWSDLKKALSALAAQDFDEAAEFLLVENRDDVRQMPEEILDLLPGLRIVPSTATLSYALKMDGVEAASGELVAILDADCVPDSNWLRSAVGAMRSNPSASAISGRTSYAGRTLSERTLGLLSRSYVDRGKPGATPFVSTNNVIFRRAALKRHPFPLTAGPFAFRMQTEAIRREGGQLLFEPTMRVVHDFEGWGMERDLRRSIGWTTVRIRQLDEGIPFASAIRLGAVSIPLFVGYKILESWWKCITLYEQYGLSWYDVPYSLIRAVTVHLLEIPGMLSAFRGEAQTASAFR